MIFNKLFYMLLEDNMKDYFLIRVTIREDENFGEAIIQRPDGTPTNWSWNNENKMWE